MRLASLRLALTLGTLAAAFAPPAPADAAVAGRAVIRRTEYGIPHIEARSYAGLGYGYGYAFAQDNLCTMAEDYVTVDARRSRWFGSDGTYEQRGAGVTTRNLDSDLFWQQVKDSGIVGRLVARKPPFGPRREVKDAIRGYVAGYNRYVRSVGRRGVPDPTCRGKGWVRPITLGTAYRRLYQLALLASGDVAIPGIGQAQPPAAKAGAARAARSVDVGALARALARRSPGAGSNAVAIGRAGTRDRRHGLLLGNPHFPWLGPERFYQVHLTLPGELDVSGVALFGVPSILIGHTRTMAWSHTVSTAYRFTPYQLTLAPGSPTTYVVDGKRVKMTHRTVRVPVRRADGRLGTVRRTLYSTRWGPVLTSLMGTALPWNGSSAFAFADANRTNFRLLNHFWATNRARSAPEELAILKRYEGIPWVNTIVADRAGNALYADMGTVPHVTPAEAARCNTAIGRGIYAQIGLPILDGSRSSCRWGTDADAVAPGLLGPRHLPFLLRSDYATNSNDSYWLSNPAHPLEGFPRIVGPERTARSLRTRIGLLMVEGRVKGTDGLGPAGFTRADMQRLVLSDRQYAGELTRDAFVALCRGFAGGLAPTSSGPAVPVGNACDVLAGWDEREDLDSRGAILFRRVLAHAFGAAALFSNPFNPLDPVRTPNTLNVADPVVRTAIGDAIADLRGAKIALDARVSDVQGVVRGGRLVPVPGGPGDPNGQFNAIYAPFTPGRGFAPVQEGSSYIQVVTWHAGPCPDAATILTYSESANPRSRHFADQTRLFSRKRWVTGRFCRRDVLAHTRSTKVLIP